MVKIILVNLWGKMVLVDTKVEVKY
jgi:hypothetical protein